MNLTITDEIINYLIQKDANFSNLYNLYGKAKLEGPVDVFQSIVSSIIGQQLSIKAKRVIFDRFINKIKDFTPEAIIKTSDEDIRNCGISFAKIKYIKELAQKVINKEYDFNGLELLSDEELIQELCKIKGVGIWTAEMLALFTFRRKNIFSYSDVALKNGIMKAKGYKTLSLKRFNSLKKLYSPYCSYASLYFYAHNDNELRWK